MIYIFAAFLWPVLAVAIYFGQAYVLPDVPPPSVAFLSVTAALGMGAFLFAGVLRLLGFLRDDKTRKEKRRDEP